MRDLIRNKILARLEEQPETSKGRNSFYALGDAGFNIYWTTTETFLFFFFTDVYRLPTASLAIAVLLARTIDLVAGPAIGIIADRTGSRFGRYRPYLFLFSLPLSLFFFVLFSAPSTWPHGIRSLFTTLTPGSAAAVALLGFSLFYALTNIPYTALLAVITTDSSEKQRLSSLRFAAAAAAVLTVQFATLPLVQRLGGGVAEKGWQRTALLYGMIASLAILCCAGNVREIGGEAARSLDARSDLVALLRTRKWYGLMATTILALCAFTCRGGVTLYYMRYVMNRPDLTHLFLVANSAAALGACLLVSWLPKRFVAPHTLLLVCSIAGAVASVSLFCISRDHLIVAFVAQTLFGFSTGALLPAIFALFADLPFAIPTLRGRSVNGVIAATSLIALKCGGLVGAAILAVTLAKTGYLPDQTQPLAVRNAIMLMISVIPAAILLLCWLTSRSLAKCSESN